ncbi:hypothetical protein HA402_008082 [Bradysia odoriphaga]|nr:hypothetical protein HA402_008082 [Bradysia odoriphaga]
MVVLLALGVGIFIYIICSLSQSVKYYVKCSFFVLGAMFSAAVLPIPSLLVYPIRDPRIGLVPALGTRFIMWLMGLTYEVRGEQHINREKGGVIVINHQSGIDLAIIARIWPLIGRGTTVVKKFVLYVFPFGPGAWLWGTLYIDRKNHKDTLVKLDKECEAIKMRSNKIVIFPEGTRSQEDELLPFKKGPFHIAIQSQSMIQPIVVSKYHFLSDRRRVFGKGHTIITVLPEISCQGLTKDDLPQLLERTRNLMQTTFTETSKETKHSAVS